MKPFFSIKLWLIFLHRMAKAIYPADMVLMVFALPELKKIKESRAMRFLVIFLLCNLAVRLVPFFACVPFSERYFFPFAVNIAILATYGISNLVEFLDTKIIKGKIKVSKFQLYALLVLIIGLSYTAKALMPRNDKPWLKMIPAAMKRFVPTGKTPIIISNDLDERWGYYAQTNQLYRLHPEQDWLLMKQVRVGREYRWEEFDEKRGIPNLQEKIESLGMDWVFIILKVEKSGTSKSEKELVEKFTDIHLVGTFTDRKKRVFKLYTTVLPGKPMP